ncbi:MAG: glycosyltransferase family 1 protein [Chloroflexi bacterium]|nr:glycosyltransferase family 1 protein [Chloroflexota bacterium]
MKICLASIHPRMLSGQIEGLIALAEALQDLGHSVQIASAFSADQILAEKRWAVATSDEKTLASKFLRIGGVVRTIAQLSKDCDLLHFNLPTPAFAFLADVVQLALQKPMVVGFEAHLASVPQILRRLPAAPQFYLPRLMINNSLVARATLRRSRRWVVSSEYQRRELVGLGYPDHRVDVIANLIDYKKLTKGPRLAARSALGLPDAPLVVFAGHYHDVKGHDLLIEAFREVVRERPEARLVFAWSGIGNRSKVQAQIAAAGLSSHFIELGRVAIGDLFSAADLVVLPYRFSIGQAAFPGTVLEAMWLGVPLVTSRLPLLRELVEDGREGLLANPGDPADLAQQMVRLLNDEALCERMVEAQQEKMQNGFSAARLAEAYVSTYERALEGQTRVLQPA